jgi:hypothetical protein
MILRDILKKEGLFGNDIRERVSNGQLTINNKKISNVDLDREIFNYDTMGDFLFKNIKLFNTLKFLSVDEIFECDIPFIRKELENKELLKISKKQLFVLYLC